MALVTIAGSSIANSYGSIIEANTYFTDRGITTWTGTDAVKEANLIKAAFYLDNSYRGRFKGLKSTSAQALAFPRAGIVDYDGYGVLSDTIPQNLKNAQFEAALLLLTGVDLGGSIGRSTKMEKIGQIQVEYKDGAAELAQYPKITNYLIDYVFGGASIGGSVTNGLVVRS